MAYQKKTQAERFWPKVTFGKKCWTWNGSRDSKGYGQFNEHDGSGNRNLRAHRVAWELSHGPIPEGLHVLHRCDNPSCVKPSHLRLGSHTDNMREAYGKRRSGRTLRRGRIPSLSAAQRAEIKARYSAGGVLLRELADEYGVSYATAQRAAKARESGSP